MWILKLLKNDSLRNEIGKNGREFVRSNFSWEASATQLQALMLAQNSRTVV
jgi:glycosyltransferase involved in cell wall biosynthesis